eukprot:TRINITY_DN33414_c0_g1_i1.p1 TRINITY_DN33414_c0_g1~~TRINITY_DN33414_c0_g1_i1.p1  ORF type:complete len:501 (-),score=96.36 TRINITY_DN33414_c0_g1_i1:15-1517(-)
MGAAARRSRGGAPDEDCEAAVIGKDWTDDSLEDLELEGFTDSGGRGNLGTMDDKPVMDAPASSLQGEYANIALLLLLYTLQGIPMGLSAVLPLVLKERGVSYSDLGTFSLNSYPFCLKLLWAPIVDAAYMESFGRRKTWMVPAQLLIGVVMLGLSLVLSDLLYVDVPDVRTLTVLFFMLYFLCATQDIAVDGWALTMLRKENVGYAATCNTVGQTFGYSVGFTGFMVLEQFGLMTLPRFMGFWGVVFLVVTVAVAILKSEKPVPPEDEPEDIPTAYRQMLSMLRLRSVRQLTVILFTWKACFAVMDGLNPLKLQEYGMPKEHMAYLTSLLMPVYILLPIVVARWTSSAEPLELALTAYPWKVLLLPISCALVYSFPRDMVGIPWFLYLLIFLAALAVSILSQCMFVSQMAFFARVSDPAMGGTCMTLMNTLANLGGMWPQTIAMKMVDSCTCTADTCVVKSDGFYVMSFVCFGLGIIWTLVGIPPARRLQQLKLSDWRVR